MWLRSLALQLQSLRWGLRYLFIQLLLQILFHGVVHVLQLLILHFLFVRRARFLQGVSDHLTPSTG
ncbi:hypothetical protein PMAYCL1PPCAC_31015, partial [Pristionchus mayeri]